MKRPEVYLEPEQLGTIDKWCRSFALIVGIPLILVWLIGCASMDYDWQKTRHPSQKPWVYVTVENIDLTCRQMLGTYAIGMERIYGCATWRPVGCVIYLPPAAAAWTRRHEERHCEGWTH